MLKTASLIGLILYFAILLLVVLKEKKNSDVEDYFFAGRSLPFWALSITFIASWWGGGSALSTADLAFADGMGAFWYYGVPVLVATLLMGLGARAIRSVGWGDSSNRAWSTAPWAGSRSVMPRRASSSQICWLARSRIRESRSMMSLGEVAGMGSLVQEMGRF